MVWFLATLLKEELIVKDREGPYEIVLSSLCLGNPSHIVRTENS